jgi:hypothetical protein
MPCRDYQSDSYSDPADSWQFRELKARADMLARIACKAMTELESNSIGDFLLLRDDEVRTWWLAHKEADRKAQEARVEKARLAKVRRDALKKLTDEERKVLGIKK